MTVFVGRGPYSKRDLSQAGPQPNVVYAVDFVLFSDFQRHVLLISDLPFCFDSVCDCPVLC